ncbi:MAG TPA: TonB-dependent receptor plug domain-containing protein, partial [Phnomibacter sp.]|nr:TonB-dependent receptor plug domain-containing protein [Phnomibacter sp.]
MKSRIRLLLLGLLMVSLNAIGQERNVTGKVTNAENSEPLVGVTVTNTKTNKRTQTDAQGNFSLQASTGDALQFSFVGFTRRTVTVGSSGTYNIAMVATDSDLGEVVVTAFGIKRQKKSLGYATQEIKGDEVAETQRENFINSLQGRVAGATVNSTSGAPGASAQIVLRGFNSLSGSNSPLFILDGLPVNNNSFNQGLLASDLPNRSNDYSNRGIDINPDDIESITILKGPEATALYGIDAGSGAIVITTKKGKAGKLKISYDNSFRAEFLYRFPDIQTVYSTGVNGAYDSTTRNRFGPKWPEGTQLYDNVRNFFDVGFSQKHNINFQGGSKKFTYRANATFQDQQGAIPNTRFTRFAPRLTLDNQIGNKLKVTNTIGYTHTFNRKAFRGAGGFLNNLMLWPNDDNVKDWETTDGGRRKVVDDPNFAEADNPYWDVYRNQNIDRNDRYIYNLSVSYDPLKWLNITGRGGVDWFHLYGEYMYHPQSNPFRTVGGLHEYYKQDFRSFNGNLIATAKHKIGKFGSTIRVGTAIDDFKTKSWSERSEQIGTFFDFFANTDPARRQNSRQRGRDTLTQRRLQGVFGE